MRKLKYFVKDLRFIKSLWSPFKPFKLKWYVGKTAVGTPYFFPRKWVKATPEMAHEAVLEYIKREENYNKLNPNYARKIRPYDEVYKEKIRCKYAVPKKIGFDFVSLGYKIKWTNTDYRFEWSPRFSFVFFGYQIAVTFVAQETYHYWETWLYYENDTDKTKSKRERIEQCRREFPQKWSTTMNGKTETIDYYNLILKEKYI